MAYKAWHPKSLAKKMGKCWQCICQRKQKKEENNAANLRKTDLCNKVSSIVKDIKLVLEQLQLTQNKIGKDT